MSELIIWKGKTTADAPSKVTVMGQHLNRMQLKLFAQFEDAFTLHINQFNLRVEAEETVPGWLYRCQGSSGEEEKLMGREGGWEWIRADKG